jgi:hypothetical protein
MLSVNPLYGGVDRSDVVLWSLEQPEKETIAMKNKKDARMIKAKKLQPRERYFCSY